MPRPGRPRGYDRGEVLGKALGVFHRYGYEGASMARILDATGMKAPSLYHAFGDKEQLFQAVLEHYHQPYREAVSELFGEPSTLKAFRSFFDLARRTHCCTEALGCLIVNSSVVGEEFGAAIPLKVKALQDLNERLIYQRLRRGQEAGHLDPDEDVRKLARYINGVIQGAAVLARGQQSTAAVRAVLDLGWEQVRSRIRE